MDHLCPSAFISANSEGGFASFYETVFDNRRFDRIFVLFGGPGTGKSTLLWRYATAAEEAGAYVERILCSSDPTSLDGVIATLGGRKVGVVDGTPPHARIITAPATREELWDLSRFWNIASIQARKQEIEELNEKKRASFFSAYRYLRALGIIAEEQRLAFLSVFDKVKAEKQIRYKIHTLKQKGEAEHRFLRAHTTMGEYVSVFPSELIQNVVLIGGKDAEAEIYLSLLSEMLCKQGYACTVYHSPLSPKHAEGVYIPETQTLFLKERLYSGEHRGRRIMPARFARRVVREDTFSKERDDLIPSLTKLALTSLAEAGKTHFRLEEIYRDAACFEKAEETKDTWIRSAIHALTD